MNKKTVVFDFDGVIHSYTSGWIGDTAIPDPPFPGIREAIVDIRKKYRVVVVSTRCASEEGKAAIKEWLAKYDIVVDDITKEKPPAVVYIDDRAICFDGHADLLAARIEAFQPFYSAKHAGFLTFEDAQKWYDAYHRVKHELERERMYHRETEKLADKYFAECKHLQRMLEAAIAGQETLQKETSKWVKECEELQERLIEYEKDLARQIFGKIEKIVGEKYSFFVHKSEYDEEVEAIINFSDSISNDIDDLKEKYIGDGEGEDHE